MPQLRGADALFPAKQLSAVTWHETEWYTCSRAVRQLQARIVKAIKEGRFWLAKNLQRLLTHSYTGKLMAVRRVTGNKGKRSAGVDGKLWSTAELKEQASRELKASGYQALYRLYTNSASSVL